MEAGRGVDAAAAAAGRSERFGVRVWGRRGLGLEGSGD